MRVFQAMLVLRDVSRPLGKGLLLNRASVEFPPDVPTAVVGFAPSEREAFLRLLAGDDKPQTGVVRLAGEDVARLKREKGRIIRVGPNGTKPSGQRVRRLISEDAAGRVGLSAVLGAAVSDLDLDKRVRLAIALACEAKPGLVLLDSPSSELGGDARRQFLADLKGMFAGMGGVVVLAGTLAEARAMGGRLVVVVDGRIVQEGAVEEVMARPANLAAARAITPDLNVVAMTARGGAGVLADGSVFQPPEGLDLPASGPCTLAFHPGDVTLERAGAGCVRFVVRAAGEAEGADGMRYARVRFADATCLAPLPSGALSAGLVLNAFVDRTKLMVFDSEGKAFG